MSALQIALRDRIRRPELKSLVAGFALLASCVLVARLLSEPTGIRIGIVAIAALMIVGLSTRPPVVLLGSLLIWLSALGLLRRVLNTITPVPHADPLLLVGPLAMAVLFIAAAGQGAFNNRSRLASAVLALNALAIIGALNPLQGGVATGLGGLLFILVPTLAFWVGRGLFDDRQVGAVLKLLAVLSIPAAVYGLAQTFGGFPSWDAAWLAAHKANYGALTIHGVPRAFGSFSAASEYATFLAIGLVVWAAFGLTPVLAPVAVGAIGMLAFAIFWEGSRGIIVLGIAALAMMAGARTGARLKWSLALTALLILLLPSVVGYVVGAGYTGSSSPLVERQVQGLRDPTNPDFSTLGAHWSLLIDGVRSARHEPVGQGTGAVTLAGLKFGGANAATEADPSNAAVAWGIPGLLAYFVILAAGLVKGYRLAFARRDWLATAALAIVILTTSQWLNGGQYAVAFLPWLLLGWIDRNLSDVPRVSTTPRLVEPE
jgi:hypothetical protein